MEIKIVAPGVYALVTDDKELKKLWQDCVFTAEQIECCAANFAEYLTAKQAVGLLEEDEKRLLEAVRAYPAGAVDDAAAVRLLKAVLTNDVSSDALTPQENAAAFLEAAGDRALPGYYAKGLRYYLSYADVFKLPVMGLFYDGAKRAFEAEARVRIAVPDLPRAKAMLHYADTGYGGYAAEHVAAGARPLSSAHLPRELRPVYDEAKGLLRYKGLQACLLRELNGTVVVAFSGTDVGNPHMLLADLWQVTSVSVEYLRAAGLLAVISEKFATDAIAVTGHSLGGGLAQFAVAANCNAANSGRLKGYGFNPAGLSMRAFDALKKNGKLKIAKNLVEIYRTGLDPVSRVGGLIGNVYELPTPKAVHGMSILYDCMKLL